MTVQHGWLERQKTKDKQGLSMKQETTIFLEEATQDSLVLKGDTAI